MCMWVWKFHFVHLWIQVRKRTLQSVRLDGSPDSLRLRLELSEKLSVANQKWRGRLEWILREGQTRGSFDVTAFLDSCLYLHMINQ